MYWSDLGDGLLYFRQNPDVVARKMEWIVFGQYRNGTPEGSTTIGFLRIPMRTFIQAFISSFETVFLPCISEVFFLARDIVKPKTIMSTL